MNVKLFSALLHHEQVVIAQITVPEDTTEVTCVQALLCRGVAGRSADQR